MKKLVFFLFVMLFSFNAKATTLSIISDEETENFLAATTKPIFNAAGISFNRNKVHIVNDNSLNAFVGDGNDLFIFTGTIVAARHKDELEGVIAHETGHILGGHILRGKIKAQEMQTVSLASMIAAGAAAVVSGNGNVAMAVALGSQTSLMNLYSGYRVEEERSADEAAVKLLNKMHESPAGLLGFMKQIQKQNVMSGVEETPYFRTHPVTTERVSFLINAVEKSQYQPDYSNEEAFLRVKAKLIGFLDEPKRTFARYKDQSVPAKYARSIAYFKQMNISQAMSEIDDLIAKEPNNPYFRELKGQFYLETGKVKQAKTEYKTALNLLPNSANFQLNYAMAALEDNPSNAELKEIVNVLNKSLISRPSSFSWMMISRAYGMQNDMANSNYAAAEYSYRIGAIETAHFQLEQAKKAKPSAGLLLKIDDLKTRLDDVEKKMMKF